MSKKNLVNLFGDLKDPSELVASAPQTLNSISKNPEEQEYFIKRIREFEKVKPKVDYSSFGNFVFFNSALDYFNITGDKILNEYPYDGSKDLKQAFYDDLDYYQQYVVDTLWPKNIGHLRFNPAVSSSYISIEDVGRISSNAQYQTTAGLLSPGTGSFSIEVWCIPPPALTGSNDVMVLLQKTSGSNADGYTVYFSGSKVYFTTVSGSNTDTVSCVANPGNISFYSFVYDKYNELTSIITGSTNEFPVLVTSASTSITDTIELGNVGFYIGSGSISGKVVRPLTGALDEVRFWKINRALSDTSSSFNIRQYAQPNLTALWTFNESGSALPVNTNAENGIVFDTSGYKLNGRIQRYFSAIRSSGSLISYDFPDLVLSINAPSVQSMILEQQTSGSEYDRSNDNIITKLLPEQFFELERERHDTEILQNLVYILGRDFDKSKIKIDQFVYLLRQNYGEFNQTPDALLGEIGKFFGWEFTGNFLSADVSQYILGKNILHNLENNKEIEKKLFQIKNEFWKRTLLNLIYLYKTKGTRESVESLLRVYGVNNKIVRLKEYGVRPRVGITTQRIHSEKSIPALTFGSGSYTGSYLVSSPFTGSVGAIECMVKFPTTASSDLTPSVTTGCLWTLNAYSGSDGFYYGFPFSLGDGENMGFYQLYYTKAGVASYTGSLFLSSSEGNLALTGVQLFDNRWYNIAFNRDFISGTINLSVRGLDRDTIDVKLTSSLSGNLGVSDHNVYNLWVGKTGSLWSEYWMQEVRVWDEKLSENELDDHCLNYQSYGTDEFNDNQYLKLHWRLNENITASAGGSISSIVDVGIYNFGGIGYGFKPGNQYKRFLNDYNFIASPEHGWTEELVRVLPSSKVKPRDAFTGNRLLALEFNMIDALNEDISQIISGLDNFNLAIGLPVNKYRNDYHDLDVLRKNYFKRLQGRLNFRVFADMLEFFDRSFLKMVRKLIPAHSIFIGDQFVVQSHMLERPKIEIMYTGQEPTLDIEGKLVLYERR